MSAKTTQLADRVTAELERHADAEKAAPMAAYMKTDMPFFGVQKKERAAIWRAIKGDIELPTQASYKRAVLALWKRTHPKVVGERADEWIDDDDMWIRRTAIIGQNKRKASVDHRRLFRYCLARADEKEFFIRKAIGWALREYSYAEPERVIAFLEKNREKLSGLSVREAEKRLRRDKLL